MREKSQVAGILRSFLAIVRNQFNKSVKVTRSDNGSEFLNTTVKEMFEEFRVQHQRRCTYTPQHNGVVERRHKIILQLARALLFQSGMPTMFWEEAILHATFLMNKLPLSILNWKTPYLLLFNKEVNYNDLTCFGSLCYSTNVKQKGDKFTLRASKCIFLGFSPRQKGYKLYDLDKREVIVTRNVVFYEESYPFKYEPARQNVNTNEAPLPIVPVVQEECSDNMLVSTTTELNQPPCSPLDNSYNLEDVSENLQSSSAAQILPRHSTRPRKQLAWMNDFEC